MIDAADFNGAAFTAIRWTTQQLDEAEKSFLSELPLVLEQRQFTLVHGTLRAPIVEYLLHPSQASDTFARLLTAHCAVGHSHYPFLCRENGDIPIFFPLPEGESASLAGGRCIVNPGSVGQPRDRDSRSSYAVYDSESESVEHYRVEYDIRSTQEKMRRAGLPQYLVDRLDHGV